MKKRWIAGIVALAVLGAGAGLALAGRELSRVVPVANGMTRVAFDGNDGYVIRSWRENYNAHGFDVISFHFVDKANGGQWNLVPLYGAPGKPGAKGAADDEIDTLSVSGGADCLLQDFRLLKGAAGQPMRLVVATREVGDNYAASETVRFSEYVLTRNDDGTIGWPPLYFKLVKRTQSTGRYCDVNEAFDRERHLGTLSGVAH
ncbi:carbapenem self-resistance protein CarG family protein [Burkholderia gladioli]|uniref:carbapenem self-resistance protein CarG family protein n=1 Tax=Burkholderia gladioli TaxID=28095 RepID=UPI0016420C03|nr:hypothetical protein [Burkholderia gladioli]